jgi:hypothetical protein
MFHLSMVGADAACAKHGSAAVHDVHAAQSSAHQHGHPAQNHSEQTDRCQIPATQDCCAALASCTPTVASESVTPSVGATASRAHRPMSEPTFALSRDTAPDTPPPRA